jgi:hypothetical protein
MGEGWSDYIACVNNNMITVVGSWVLNDPAGIRDFPYDSNFPDHFGKLGTGRYLSSKPHNIGEIWCATLMEMTRNVGINPSLQIVIDALKLSPANPSFLDMRDAILQAAQDLRTVGRITAREHFDIRRQITKVFSRFQMGPRAQSNAAQLTGIVGDPESHWENAAMHGGFLVQSTFGLPSRESGVPLRGNFELVTPLLGGGMSHFWRDNDTVGSPWHGPIPFGARDAVEAISAIQSNLSSSGNGPGNLEVVARVGDRLHFYSRDDAPPFSWHGPDPIPGATSGVAGVPSMLQSRFGA